MNPGTGGRTISIGLLVLRVGVGSLLIYGHGWPKLVHFAERVSRFANPIGLGPELSFGLVVLAEVVCAAAVMLGLATRAAAVPLVIFFLVAALIQHAPDPWAKKELALVYLVPYLTLLVTGGGRFSLDSFIARWFFARPIGRSES